MPDALASESRRALTIPAACHNTGADARTGSFWQRFRIVRMESLEPFPVAQVELFNDMKVGEEEIASMAKLETEANTAAEEVLKLSEKLVSEDNAAESQTVHEAFMRVRKFAPEGPGTSQLVVSPIGELVGWKLSESERLELQSCVLPPPLSVLGAPGAEASRSSHPEPCWPAQSRRTRLRGNYGCRPCMTPGAEASRVSIQTGSRWLTSTTFLRRNGTRCCARCPRASALRRLTETFAKLPRSLQPKLLSSRSLLIKRKCCTISIGHCPRPTQCKYACESGFTQKSLAFAASAGTLTPPVM